MNINRDQHIISNHIFKLKREISEYCQKMSSGSTPKENITQISSKRTAILSEELSAIHPKHASKRIARNNIETALNDIMAEIQKEVA